jgi:hypothetical protein
LSAVSAFVAVSSPRVAKSTDFVHGNDPSLFVVSASGSEVISHVVVENTAKTGGSTFKVLADFDVDGFLTVPFHHQTVSLFFNDDVTGNVADMDGKESRWKSKSFAFFVKSHWVTFSILFKVDVCVLEVDLDFPVAVLVSSAIWIVDHSDGERARVSIFNKSVFAVA